MLAPLHRCFTAAGRAALQLLAVQQPPLLQALQRHQPLSSSAAPSSAHDMERHIAVLQAETREALARADFEGALGAAQACLETSEAHFGRAHAATACALNNVGQVHRQRGGLAEALPLLQDAVEAYRLACGEEHASTAQAQANLGLLHAALAQRGKGVERLEHVEVAQALLERALASKRKALGEGHAQVGVAMYQLASAVRLQRRHAAAEALLLEAVARLRAAEGARLPLATALNNLGLLRKELGQHASAQEAYREALQLRVAQLGEAHPDSLTSLHNLAECVRAAGDEEGAQTLQRSILRIMGHKEGEGEAGPDQK
jgi:tetratricopeptide (TPR) repeat protein